MPGLGARFGGSWIPLVARASLLLVSVVVTLGGYLYNTLVVDGAESPITRAQIVLPALLLLVIAALASIPLPPPLPTWVQPVAETLAASIVVGAVGPTGRFYFPYLVAPVVTAGLTAGTRVALTCAGISGPVLAAAIGASAPERFQTDLGNVLLWMLIFVVVGALGGAVKRMRDAERPEGEPAYADAHRLLSELHVVARQLSLGLDPPTLAAALVDDVRAVVRHGSASVLVRSPGGRFVPLVGEAPPEPAEGAIEDAWVSAQAVRISGARTSSGENLAVLPVLMGERVVALVSLASPFPLDDDTLQRTRAVIEQSGPRMASAMMFDEVRRLATVDERMRLAREIHDGIAQDLASVGYLLDDIRGDVDDDVGGRVVQVREQLRGMVSDLRLSIFDLRSSVDDTIGLGTALSEHVQRVGSQSGLVVHVSMDESPRRLPIATEVELLRMVQEALTNVRKHARAQNVWVSLWVDAPKARITVSDDGRGLQRGRSDSMGITGMHERARRIGARLTVAPRAEGGTMVEIELDGSAARERAGAQAGVPASGQDPSTR